MFRKILDIIAEFLDIFGNWLRIREQDKLRVKTEKVSKDVDNGEIDELNKTWKKDL